MEITAFIGPLGWPEIVVILIVILPLFGGKKLPELAKGVAKGLKTFRREMNDVKGHVNEAIEASEKEEEEAAAAAAAESAEPKKTESTVKEDAQEEEEKEA